MTLKCNEITRGGNEFVRSVIDVVVHDERLKKKKLVRALGFSKYFISLAFKTQGINTYDGELRWKVQSNMYVGSSFRHLS
jgi:hypothetical protein